MNRFAVPRRVQIQRALRHAIRLAVGALILLSILGSSALEPDVQSDRIRAFTHKIEFDFAGWTLKALQLKLFETALGTSGYLTSESRHAMVVEYLELITHIQQAEWRLKEIYANPQVADPQAESAPLRRQIEDLNERRQRIEPVAEDILQGQIASIAGQYGLTLGGQPLPPVLYHSTPLPLALIVSPRNVIRQDDHVSLLPDLSVDQQVALEERVDRSLNVSSLVEEIGGVGTYPTMVQQTGYLAWLSEVVAHEWVHNYLTLRPLGLSYMKNPELRIMNETAASIAGKELGRAVLEAFYPELVPPPPDPNAPPPPPPDPTAFNFRKEMHETRLTVDQMLAEGRIEEAEYYMEQRRRVFWDNGYHQLRKLNQAYFAFHGAYADEPGGAAGAAEDPVGEAVRLLRAQSPSLAAFLKRISWMYSFEQLQEAVRGV
jgi:hypothetical protein